METYVIYPEPDKSVVQSNLLRVDLVGETTLEEITEIKDLDYDVHTNDPWSTKVNNANRKTVYLTINH